MTTQLPTPTARVAKRAGLFAGIGAGALIIACAAACAIPVVAAAGVALGGGALIAGAWPIAVGVLLLTAGLTVALLWFKRRRVTRATAATCATDGSCGCA